MSTLLRAPYRTAMIVAACCALSPSIAVAQQGKTTPEYQVVGIAPDDVLNLRQDPDPTSRVISRIAPNSVGIRGTGRKATVRNGTWLEITSIGKTGWVNARYIAEVKKDEGRRIAVIIGNNSYKSLPALTTPRSDAEAISSTLKPLGFQVSTLIDAEYQSTQDVLREQFRKLKPSDTIIFFFAGHGTHTDNKNIFFPVDAPAANAIEPGRVLVIDDIQKAVADTGAKSIFIMDASRDVRAGPTVNKGLLRTDPYPNMLVAYSTSPGKVASDGIGANSPYARALVRALKQPDLDATTWVRLASQQAADETSHLQTPTFTSTLDDPVILSSPKVVLASHATERPLPERRTIRSCAYSMAQIERTQAPTRNPNSVPSAAMH
jgi:hypothetical protein